MRTRDINARRREGHFPYYKVQHWDPVTIAWRDVQRSFTTPDLAFKHGHTVHPRVEVRVMTITRKGREIFGREGPAEG